MEGPCYDGLCENEPNNRDGIDIDYTAEAYSVIKDAVRMNGTRDVGDFDIELRYNIF